MNRERARELTESLNLPGWQFVFHSYDIGRNVSAEPLNVGAVDVRKLNVADSRASGRSMPSFSSNAMIQRHFTDEDFARAVFGTVQWLADHELREFFSMGGFLVFDPHNYSAQHQRTCWDTESARNFYQVEQRAVGGRPFWSMRSRVAPGVHGAKRVAEDLFPSGGSLTRYEYEV